MKKTLVATTQAPLAMKDLQKVFSKPFTKAAFKCTLYSGNHTVHIVHQCIICFMGSGNAFAMHVLHPQVMTQCKCAIAVYTCLLFIYLR